MNQTHLKLAGLVLLGGGLIAFLLPVHVAVGAGALLGGALLLFLGLRTKKVEGQATLKEAATEFLSKKRVAVTGVSRTPQTHGANIIYQRLRQRGFQVFPINPRAEVVEGDRAFPDLKSIPGGVDAVVIGTRPETGMTTLQECAELGIKHVWMHGSFGGTSVSPEAVAWGRAHGIRVIDGGCPLMFEPAADPGHKVMRCVFSATGGIPHHVP